MAHQNRADHSEMNSSRENLLDEGPNEIAVVPSEDYLSLVASRNRFSPQSSQLAESYFGPRIRNSISNFYRRHRPRHGRRGHRTTSKSSKRETEDIKNRFKKLQIYVGFVCGLSVVILSILILIHPKLSPFFAKEENDFFTTEDGETKTFKLCTKCGPLVAKAGFSGGLIADIRSAKYTDFCCFRRIDQLLDLFDGYAKTFVNQELFKVRQQVAHNITVIKDDIIPPPFPLAHLFYKNVQQSQKGSAACKPLTWETKGVDILLQGDMSVNALGHLRVPKSGYYYIYSSLHAKGDTVHRVVKNFKEKSNVTLLKTQIQVKHSFVSELQGVFRLIESDSISVCASENAISGENRETFFGAFIVEH